MLKHAVFLLILICNIWSQHSKGSLSLWSGFILWTIVIHYSLHCANKIFICISAISVLVTRLIPEWRRRRTRRKRTTTVPHGNCILVVKFMWSLRLIQPNPFAVWEKFDDRKDVIDYLELCQMSNHNILYLPVTCVDNQNKKRRAGIRIHHNLQL